MKKMYSAALFSLALLLFSYHLHSISDIGSGSKVISKCCKGLSAWERSSKNINIGIDKEMPAEKVKDDTSLLPFYSWDIKMIML